MNGYILDLEGETKKNKDYRRVLYTTLNSQLVLMNIKSGDEIGAEVHDKHDQFIRIEEGEAKVVLDGEECELKEDMSVTIPAGVNHNVINTGDEDLKLYTIYTPPEHKKTTVHVTKEEADADGDHHFDGETDV